MNRAELPLTLQGQAGLAPADLGVVDAELVTARRQADASLGRGNSSPLGIVGDRSELSAADRQDRTVVGRQAEGMRTALGCRAYAGIRGIPVMVTLLSSPM